ncbi:MAG: type II toxin-antitoxin system YoeB family toxin [Angelakisella sp.]|nr:type II toxin-antitoxin system YoeB family toxin [Angelakisella sp.]
MGKITFTEEGWADYTCWQTQDKRTLRRVNQLLQDILRGGYEGIGKPEPLKGDLRTCIHNHPIPSGRLFFRPAVLKILELHQVVLRIFAAGIIIAADKKHSPLDGLSLQTSRGTFRA